MNVTALLGIVFVGLFVVLMLVRALTGRLFKEYALRPIPAFRRLGRTIALAVEDGTRLHISLGRGSITGPRSPAGYVGLSVLERIAQVASDCDAPPVATSGDGALAILSQSTLRRAYKEVNAIDQYQASAGRLTGVTPFSFAAGTLSLVKDEDVSANLLVGGFGPEVALITDNSSRSGAYSLAGTDSIPAQAILYATADDPLLGEELYASGAYIQAGPMHTASLRAQDIMRWVLVVVILVGTALKFLGILS